MSKLSIGTILLVYDDHELRYGKFTMFTVLIQFVSWGCHGNGKISYIPDEFLFLEDCFSHLVGPSEHFVTHEKLSWGCKVG